MNRAGVTGALLERRRIDDFRPLGAFGQPAYLGFSQLRAAVLARLGPDCANFFAVPHLDVASREMSWYAHRSGDVSRWVDLDPAQQARVAFDLETIKASVQAYTLELRQQVGGNGVAYANLIEQAIRIPADDHLFVVGGKPVAAFWSFESEEGVSVEALSLRPRAPAVALRDPPVPIADAAPPPAAGMATTAPATRPSRWPWWLALALLLLLLLVWLLWPDAGREETAPPARNDEVPTRPTEPEAPASPDKGAAPAAADRPLITDPGRALRPGVDGSGVVVRPGEGTGLPGSVTPGTAPSGVAGTSPADPAAGGPSPAAPTPPDAAPLTPEAAAPAPAVPDPAAPPPTAPAPGTEEPAPATPEPSALAPEPATRPDSPASEGDKGGEGDKGSEPGPDPSAPPPPPPSPSGKPGLDAPPEANDRSGKPAGSPEATPPPPGSTGKPLDMPAHAAAGSPPSFLEGGWRGSEPLYESGRQQMYDLSLDFDGEGKGEVIYRRRSDGQVCRSPVQGNMVDGQLQIRGAAPVRCPDGVVLPAPVIDCTRSRNDGTRCQGRNPGGPPYDVDLNRQR